MEQCAYEPTECRTEKVKHKPKFERLFRFLSLVKFIRALFFWF